MLTIEVVLALDNAEMMAVSEFLGSFFQSRYDIEIRDGRVLDRCVLFCGPLKADRTGRDHEIPAKNFFPHSAGSTDPDEGVRTAVDKLLDCDGRGWSANSGGDDADFLAVKISGICCVLPVLGNLYRVVKMSGDLFTASRITRKDHIASDFPCTDADMVFFFFCINKFAHRTSFLSGAEKIRFPPLLRKIRFFSILTFWDGENNR